MFIPSILEAFWHEDRPKRSQSHPDSDIIIVSNIGHQASFSTFDDRGTVCFQNRSTTND
jgi:hypothetical protein